VFPSLPSELVERLEDHYLEIKQNFASARYEPSELNGGKICEIVFRILEWHTNPGTYTPLGQRLDINKLVNRLENATAFNDTVRFHIPRILWAIYSVRNKRGVAHHAGEIDSNHMDAVFIVASADWVMAELVRLFHGVHIDEARSLVESLTTKQIPIIWEVGDLRRVLPPPGTTLSTKDKVLLLLYHSSPDPVSVGELLQCVEYGNSSRFRKGILKDLHKDGLLHFDVKTDSAQLSPIGIVFVENNLPLDFQV
jgi:hypothetical protein